MSRDNAHNNNKRNGITSKERAFRQFATTHAQEMNAYVHANDPPPNGRAARTATSAPAIRIVRTVPSAEEADNA